MQCTATVRSTGQQCRKSAIAGAQVCRSHGGAARQVKAAAARNMLEQQARQLWAKTVHAPVNDPLSELAKLAGEVLAWKQLLKDKIGELTTVGYRGMTSEQIKSEVVLYNTAVSQLTTVLTGIAKLNIDSRLAAISEKQAAVVIAALEAGLDAAGIDHSGRFRARQAAARHLELVRSEAS
ncbi:hypothetical protein [Amycolatopsis pithecellobii]|uniref:Uncharacterized protein n=1 Tax=Amycolatopsis pithecellobii TaxID=664692 RepID=A0A6N7Z591_9PSEU|nr:hypothetical protein [Amycolatopsis pithecellobii]MTD55704.1 hypothetical protein [Amycolatopsis pithecellobii]